MQMLRRQGLPVRVRVEAHINFLPKIAIFSERLTAMRLHLDCIPLCLGFSMLRAFAVASFLGLSALSFLPLATAQTGSAATEPRTFMIPDNDGYGVGECLAAGPASGCGRIVADAWCESKGFAKAVTFGKGDPTEVTGSVQEQKADSGPKTPGVVMITCGE